jgi:hypothetical protein
MFSQSRFRPLPLLLLLCLVFFHPSTAKKGGGDIDLGGGGSSSGGGDSSSDDSDNPNDPNSDACQSAIRSQEFYVYNYPGSYYNGSLTVTHTLRERYYTLSQDPNNFNIENYNAVCRDSNMGIKTYTFPDAELHVGPPLDGNDTNSAFWALRAFMPFHKDAYEFAAARGAKREIFRIESAAYGYSLQTYGSLPKPTECWNTSVVKDQSTSSYNLTSQYK